MNINGYILYLYAMGFEDGQVLHEVAKGQEAIKGRWGYPYFVYQRTARPKTTLPTLRHRDIKFLKREREAPFPYQCRYNNRCGHPYWILCGNVDIEKSSDG